MKGTSKSRSHNSELKTRLNRSEPDHCTYWMWPWSPGTAALVPLTLEPDTCAPPYPLSVVAR